MTATPPSGLQPGRSRPLVVTASLVAAVVVILVAWWFLTHPRVLSTGAEPITATVPAEQSLYLGVYTLSSDQDRSLAVDGVKVRAQSTTSVEVIPWLCRGGAPEVTSDPVAFCGNLHSTENARLRPGDSIVLEVRGEVPGSVVVDRIRIGYRDGLQAATQEAGRPAVVTIAGS